MRFHHLLFVAILLPSACQNPNVAADEPAQAVLPPPPQTTIDASANFGEAAPVASLAIRAPNPESQPTPRSVGAQDPMLIRQGSVVLDIDSLEASISTVRALAARLGGTVANVHIHVGDPRWRQATLELRVPAERFDEAIQSMQALGKLEALDLTTQDVTEDYIDLTSRLTNARRLEERLLRLLDTRTAKLEEVLQVERELARIRSEIERYEGRIRFLDHRISMSRITATLKEEIPVPLRPNADVGILGQAYRDAWRNFIATTGRMIEGLGSVLPLLIILILMAGLWRIIRRARRVRNGSRRTGKPVDLDEQDNLT